MGNKKVLILNAGHTEVPIIKVLKELGYYVITTGNRGDLYGHKMADKYIKADYSDKEAVLRIAESEKVDRIVSGAHDLAYISTAYACEMLGIPGHDNYENACIIHQKDKFKALCERVKIPNPKSIPFNSEESALNYISETQFPVMVKAIDQASGIGIMKAEDREQGYAAVRNAFDKSKHKRIVIEPFIEGEQESFAAFVVNKKVVCCTSCDCYSPINPFLIQTETMPSKNFDELKQKLISITETIFNELDLVDGLITLQYIVKDGMPYIIEAMRRCLGNRFLCPVSYVTGLDWYKAMTYAELGENISDLNIEKPIANYAGHHAIMSTKNGVYEGTEIPKKIMEHVLEYDELFKKGEVIKNYMMERMGYIYYTYETREELDAATKHYNEDIILKVK